MKSLRDVVEAALRASPELHHIQSIVVASAGDLQLEQYFRDRRANDLSNVHSIIKSVIATLAGIAIDRRAMTLETTLGELLDAQELPHEERKRDISIELATVAVSTGDAAVVTPTSGNPRRLVSDVIIPTLTA